MLHINKEDIAGIMALPAANDAEEICRSENAKGSVLVANGDKQVRKQLQAILDSMGYDVVVARNGGEALDLFLKRSFDLVFTALKMPGMDGLTLSLQVKATSLNTTVVLILDEHIENIMNRIKAGRIDSVMSKPLGFEKIQETVQYFNGKKIFSNRIF